MKAATAIGIGTSILGLLLGSTMEGTSPAAFINIPAMLIVFVGTFGATLAGSTMEQMKKIPALYKKAISPDKPDASTQLELLVGFAERARREGLLALDDEVAELEDAFTKKGLQLVVDGTDPELVREILENEIDGMASRHHHGAQPFEKAGGGEIREKENDGMAGRHLHGARPLEKAGGRAPTLASSARSWASCTCSRTSRSRPRSAPPSRARSSRLSSACPRPTSCSCRWP